MSRLRTNPKQHKCQQQLGFDNTGVDRGVCGYLAVIRCNACKQYFCEECWSDHLEMTVVRKEGFVYGLRRLSRSALNKYAEAHPQDTEDDIGLAAGAQWEADSEVVCRAVRTVEERCISGRVLGVDGTVTVDDKQWRYLKSLLGVD